MLQPRSCVSLCRACSARDQPAYVYPEVQPASQLARITIYGFQGDLHFPANVSGEAGVRDKYPSRAGQGRESWLQFLAGLGCLPSLPAEGMVSFQQLRGISSCSASPFVDGF